MPVETRPVVTFVPSDLTGRAASARLRALIPARLLGEAGWTTRVTDRDGAATAGPDSVVVLQKPYDAADVALQAELAARGVRTVVDVCDNFFDAPNHRPDLQQRADRLRAMVARADVATVGTPALAELVDHPAIHLVGDAPDDVAPRRLRRWLTDRTAPLRRRTRLLWFGNAGTPDLPYGLEMLAAIVPDLVAVHDRTRVELRVVTRGRPAFEELIDGRGLPATYVEWELGAMARHLAWADLVLLPVQPNPLTLHKSPNRAHLAARHGVAVVADRIPAYDDLGEFVRFGDWRRNVAELARDHRGRRAAASLGRRIVAERHSPEAIVEQWSEALVRAVREDVRR